MANCIPTTDVSKLSEAGQAQTAEFVRYAVTQNEGAVFDSVRAAEALKSSDAPEVVRGLVSALPDEVKFSGGRRYDSAKMIADAVSGSLKQYRKEHGREAPNWVVDSALRTALPLANADYAQNVGLGSDFTARIRSAAMDEAGGISGGAMRVGQTIIAITTAFSENIPFSGSIAMGSGLEGRITLVGHQAGNNVGAYAHGDRLDGLNAGKPFMQTKRVKAGKQDNSTKTKYTATITHADTDGDTGCAIRSDSVAVHVNGILAVASSVNAKRGTPVNAAGAITAAVKGGTVKTVTATLTAPDVSNGKVEVNFSEELADGTLVHFAADVDYESSAMQNAGKRPLVEAVADFRTLRAHYVSGRYKLTQEARTQWQADVGFDPTAQASMALRQQSGAERHNLATQMMYLIGSGFQHNFNLKTAQRLDNRSLSSVLNDLTQILSEADTAMVLRTQLSGIGVIYVGAKAVSFFDSMPREMFEPSGIQRRAGVYRLGTLLGRYEVYYSPLAELNDPKKSATGFQMLCIGRSAQAAGNPYITGDVLGAQLLPVAVNDDGGQGAFYFQALADTVNPFAELASAAALINVTV